MTPVLFALAAVTGIVDAVCYLGLGQVFTANMTGNVVWLGFAAAGAGSLSVARAVTALVAFLTGAIVGARLATAMIPAMSQRWPAAAFALEAGLLVVAAAVAAGRAGDTLVASTAADIVIALTGVAMGLRSATVRRLGDRDVNTTVLTMTLTSLAADSILAGGTSPGLHKRAGSVVGILAGAALGAWLLAYSAGLALACAGAASSVCAAAAYLGTRAAPAAHEIAHGDALATPAQAERRTT